MLTQLQPATVAIIVSNEGSRRYDRIMGAVHPVLEYFRGRNEDAELRDLLAEPMGNQQPQRIFISGGAAGYMTGRFVNSSTSRKI